MRVQPIDAFHLPGLEPDKVARWEERVVGGFALRFPVLEPQALERVLMRVRTARSAYLADLPVADVVRAIDAAAARLARADDPYRLLAERALPTVTGYSAPMIRLVLDRMAEDWRTPALNRLLHAEFDDPAVLDGFRRRRAGGGWVRALGPALALHVFSGNVPGVAVTSLVRSLLVKAGTIGKTGTDEPLLPALFARLLAEVSPSLGECVAVTYWQGGDEALEGAAFRAADTVVFYGGAEAEAEIRRRVPATTRLVVHGPRMSFGVIGVEALAHAESEATAATVARAVAAYDQQGCVSPQLVYVQRGGDVAPELFAEMIARELSYVERELPRGDLQIGETLAIQRARASAEFRSLAGEPVELHASAGTEYTVIYDPDPTFNASCLNRVLLVKPLSRLPELFKLIRPHRHVLQTVAVTGIGGRLAGFAELLGRAGASRITSFENAPWPSVEWHHDGQEPLRELIRWVDLEE